MTTFVSRRLNILCIIFKSIPFFIITLFAGLYARVGIFLICGKHLHDPILLLRGKAQAHKTSLAPPVLIEVPVPNQESKRSCICVLRVSILPLSTISIGFLELF